MIEIDVRKNPADPTYLVRIGEDVYEMDSNAHQPNGVCMYAGQVSEFGDSFIPGRCRASSVPLGIVIQVGHLIEQRLEAD